MKYRHTVLVLGLVLTACTQKEIEIPAIPDPPHYAPTAQDFLESDAAILVYPERPKAEVSPVDLPTDDMRAYDKPKKAILHTRHGKMVKDAPTVEPEPATYAGKRTPGSTVVTFPYVFGAEYHIAVSPNHPVTLLMPIGLSLSTAPILFKGTDERPEWNVGFANSGQEYTYQEKIFINPGMTGLDASTPISFKSGHYFVVHLTSQDKAGIKTATWELPAQQPTTAVTQSLSATSAPTVRKPPKIALDRLHLQYEIKPGKMAVSWAPAEVYDDGILTVIRFPESLQFTSAPVLMAVEDKRTIPVEYTTFYAPDHPEKGEFYITRGLYSRLRLVDGKGGSIEIIRLPVPPPATIKEVRNGH